MRVRRRVPFGLIGRRVDRMLAKLYGDHFAPKQVTRRHRAICRQTGHALRVPHPMKLEYICPRCQHTVSQLFVMQLPEPRGPLWRVKVG